MKTFTEEPQCEACLSKRVSRWFWAAEGDGFWLSKKPARIACTCQRCGFRWTMEPAWMRETNGVADAVTNDAG